MSATAPTLVGADLCLAEIRALMPTEWVDVELTDCVRRIAKVAEIADREKQRAYDMWNEVCVERDTLANHPSAEVNRRYIVPLQVAYTSAMAERDRLAAQKEQLLAALKHIAKGEGRFSFDRLTHARNAIEDMIGIAKAALAAATKP